MDTVCASLAFIDGLGGPEMVLIFVVILVLFGGQKLPEFARGFGKSIREFKKAAAGVEEEFKRALELDERKHTTAKLAAAPAAAAATEDHPGPEAHSPDTDEHGSEDQSTDEYGHSTGDGDPYDDGFPRSDDVPSEETTAPADEIPPLADQTPGPPEDTGMPSAKDPQIMPPSPAPAPAAATPPKSAPPGPGASAPENPS